MVLMVKTLTILPEKLGKQSYFMTNHTASNPHRNRELRVGTSAIPLKIDADVDREPIHLLKMTCTLHGIHSCFARST
jgi:hypothetical protein